MKARISSRLSVAQLDGAQSELQSLVPDDLLPEKVAK